MPGNATQQYDMVLEIPESAFNEITSAAIDKILSLFINTLNKIPGVNLNPNNIFTLTVSFKKPTNIPLPVKAENPVDITMNIGQGNVAKIRTVVGADVAKDQDSAMIRLNYADKLYYCEASVGPIPDSLHLMENFLKGTVKQIPSLPLPLKKTGDSVFWLSDMDLKTIEDKSPAHLNAAADLLTFVGGAEGNKNGLKSFISPQHPDKMVIAIYFGWFCRLLQPLLAEALNIPPTSFDSCQLTAPVDISVAGEDVTLNEFALSPGSNSEIKVHVALEKSGFCYSVSATMDATIKLSVTGGMLQANYWVDNVETNFDIPWYCIVISAIIGIFTGGVLGGFVGAIIGAILAPLMTWFGEDLLNNTIGKIADSISEKINSISPKINYPLVGLNIILDDVFIDDISLISTITPIDTTPVRAEGEVTVGTGDSIDLDTGRVGGRDFLPADLVVTGVGKNVALKTLCNAAIARTSYGSFKEVTRWKLYRFPYVSPDAIAFPEMVHLDPNTNAYTPTKIFGVFTNDERFSAITVEALQGGEKLRIHYKTYAKLTEPNLEIIGGFICPTMIGEGSVLPHLSRSKIPRDAAVTYVESSLPQKIGVWQAKFQQKNNPRGKFEAISNGLNPPLDYSWYVADIKLTPPSGSLMVKGIAVHYEHYDSIVVLEVPNNLASKLEFTLAATVKDASGTVISTTGCVHYIPQCPVTQRIIPDFPTYAQKYLEVIGPVTAVKTTRLKRSLEVEVDKL